MTMNARAFLFGLNYEYDAGARLHGCINDVRNTAKYLEDVHDVRCTVLTDDVDRAKLTGLGILQAMNEAALASYTEDLDLVWLHFSGHGTYVIDRNSDEADGRDECLVPSDFRSHGVLPDDYVNRVLANFNPKTRVVLVSDCCHSGTIADLRFSWEGSKNRRTENARCLARAKVISISGCLDTQVSMDVRQPNGEAAGAMTSALLDTLRAEPMVMNNVFTMVTRVRDRLRQRGFRQVPKLCSSHDLSVDPAVIPPKKDVGTTSGSA